MHSTTQYKVLPSARQIGWMTTSGAAILMVALVGGGFFHDRFLSLSNKTVDVSASSAEGSTQISTGVGSGVTADPASAVQPVAASAAQSQGLSLTHGLGLIFAVMLAQGLGLVLSRALAKGLIVAETQTKL